MNPHGTQYENGLDKEFSRPTTPTSSYITQKIRFSDEHGVVRLAPGSGPVAEVEYYEGPDGNVVWAKKLVRADMLPPSQRQTLFDGNGGGSKRGSITTFSSQSRNRFCERMGQLAVGLSSDSSTERDFFVTLTYGKSYPDGMTAKIHLANFRKRLRRHFPDAFGIWIVELQKRGAPHFHLHLRLPRHRGSSKMKSRSYQTLFSRWWLEIAGVNGSKLAHRRQFGVHVCDARHGGGSLINYMSKTLSKNNLQVEMSKSLQKEGFAVGRWWGTINPQRAKHEESDKFLTWMTHHAANARLAEIDIALAPERRFVRDSDFGQFASVRTSWVGEAAHHLAFGGGSDRVTPRGQWCACGENPLVSTTYLTAVWHSGVTNAHKPHCVSLFGGVP